MSKNLLLGLKNGGEMGKRIREKDWAETPLGPVDDWPKSLLDTVTIAVETKFPAAVCWGGELTTIYNDAYRTLLGERSCALGAPFRKTWSEIDEIIDPLIKKTLLGKSCYSEDIALSPVNSDRADQLWLDFFFSPLRDKTGAVKGMLSISTDKTKYMVRQRAQRKSKEHYQSLFKSVRKNTEQALHESEKHLRLATKAADMHLCEVDLINKTLKWTDNIEHNIGFPMPKTLYEAWGLLHPDDKERVKEIFEQVVEHQRDFEFEYRIIDPTNDEEIWMYSAGVAIADAEGEYNRIVGVTKNITQRKIAEIRERFLTDLVNKLQKIENPEKIIDTTVRLLGEHLKADRCTYAEVGADEDHLVILGNYTRESMPAMASEGAVSAFGAEALRSMREDKPFIVDDIKKDHRIREEHEAVYKQNGIKALIAVPLHKDGQLAAKVAVHQRKPRTWKHGEEELIKAVIQDCWEAIERARVTRKLQEVNKSLEERVEKRTRALEVYQNQLRSLASELNKAEERERQRLASELHNNLGQMLAIGKMRLDTLKKADLSEHISDEVADLVELLNSALAYTRELMSDLKPPPALDKENITEVFNWLANKMKKHGLNVAVEGGHQPKRLSEEVRTTLRRCVRELLFNVIKHAGTDEARIIISYSDVEIQVIVEDKGRGFCMEEEKPTPTEEGGFGLFNVRERMDWLGGRLRITSTPGEGTRATLYAPLKEDKQFMVSDEDRIKEAGPAPVKPATQKELWQKIQVLLVDDHEMMRKGLRKLIEEQNNLVIVAEASCGEEAVALASQTSPDVIVMDVNLPDMDGIEATQKIAFARPDISIIGLSLYDSKEVARDMKDAGASFYLTKTEAFESLCATIEKAVPSLNK